MHEHWDKGSYKQAHHSLGAIKNCFDVWFQAYL